MHTTFNLATPPSSGYDAWLARAVEYGELVYSWTDFSPEDSRAAFARGDSPREFIDGLASEFGLDSYMDINWGNPPPGLDMTRYDSAP